MNMQDHSAHWKGLASDGTGIPTSCHVILLFGSEERHIGKKLKLSEGMIMDMVNKNLQRDEIKPVQSIFCKLLGGFLVLAGLGHLSALRQEFLAQVPAWLPVDGALVVVISGIIEIILGVGLIILPGRYRVILGWATAVFFVLIFPGNLSQYINRIDAFGLNSDVSRFIRLFFQPVLVIWALWSTGAWQAWRKGKTWRSTKN